MRRYRFERSRFGWWLAYDPTEPVGLFDSYTKYRAWTKDRLVRKLERRAARRRKRYLSAQAHDVEIALPCHRRGPDA